MKALIAIVVTVMTSVAYALPSDDFNDNSMNTSMWNLFQESPNVWLDETNGRLEVRSTVDANEGHAAYIANGWGFSVQGNFSFKADFHNLTSGPPDSFAAAGCILFKDWNDILVLEADYEPDNDTPSYFHYELTIAGSTIDENNEERDSTDGTLYISYDANKDEIYLSDTGYWSAQAWVTIPGLLKGEWGSAAVMPGLSSSAQNRALASGDDYLDNFVVDSGTVVQMCDALTGDLNKDCIVNFNDFAIMASNWLIDCEIDPNNPACINVTEDINNTEHISHNAYEQYFTDYVSLSDSNFQLYTWNRSNIVSTYGGSEVEAYIDDGNNVLVVQTYTGGYSYEQQYQCGSYCCHWDGWGHCDSWCPIWCYEPVYAPGSYSADYEVYGKRTEITGPAGDLNFDHRVDINDLAIFADNWLEGNTNIPSAPTVVTAFPIANTSGWEMSAGAAFDGTNFLVGIEGDATAAASITAQFVSKTGALVGSRISLGARGGAPQVGFDGTNYLLAWTEDASFSTFISGQFVSKSGTLVGSGFTIATGTDMEMGFPGVIFDGTNYFVAWRNNSTADDGDTADIFGQFITPSGAKLGSVIPISTAAHGQREPSIAFDGNNILAVWADGRNQSACYDDSCYESDVYGQFITKSSVSAAGTLSGSNFLINAGTLPRDNPTGIGFDGTNYLVTFTEQTAFDGPIWEAYGILVTKTGATIGSKFVIGNTATSLKIFPEPTYLGAKYLVTWTEGFGTTSASVKGIYITTSGTSEGSEFTLFSPALSGAVPWLGIVFTGGGVNLAVTDWGIPDMTDPFDVDLYTSADVMGAIITTP